MQARQMCFNSPELQPEGFIVHIYSQAVRGGQITSLSVHYRIAAGTGAAGEMASA